MKLYLGPAHPPIHPQHLEVMGDVNEWTFVDKYVTFPGYKQWDAMKLDEVPNGSVEKIYNSHLLEHLPHPQVPTVLKVWYDKLQSGGELIINVPDLEWLCEQLLNYIHGGVIESRHYVQFSGDNGLVSCFYGTQSHEGEYHKSGYYKAQIEELLKEAGFVNISVVKKHEAHDMGCLIVHCNKP